MIKNTANQTFHVIAFNASGRVTGDAANITSGLSIDGGTRSATGDTNPTEIGATGEYEFTLTQAETNGHELSFTPVSSTAGVDVLGAPSNVIYTNVTATSSIVGGAFNSSGPEIKFSGVTEIATGELMTSPTFEVGDVKISIAGGAFTNTTNLPTIVASGSPVLELVLTDAEFVADAIVQIVDQDSVWTGPTLYDLLGGDATLANQDEIKALLAAGATISSPVPSATTIELVEGDTYDGSSSPKLSWTVAKDYTGNTIKLAITNSDDTTTYLNATGAVESATSVTVSMDAVFATALTYPEGCQPVAQLAFALVAIDGDADEETIARGQCYVYKRGSVA